METIHIPARAEQKEIRLALFSLRCSGGCDRSVDIVAMDDAVVEEIIERLQADGYQVQRRPLESARMHPYMLIGPNDRHGTPVQHLSAKGVEAIKNARWRSQIMIDIKGLDDDVVYAVAVAASKEGWRVRRRPLSKGTAPYLIISES
jgi:hypothetical protein